jgi:CRP-like cAMP-binding protein
VVSDPAILLRVEADRFRRICFESPGLASKVIKVPGHRLRQMGRSVEELSFSTVRGRLRNPCQFRKTEMHGALQGVCSFKVQPGSYTRS